MPLPRQTIFSSTGDNAACAIAFAEAIGKLGIVGRTKMNDDGSASVFYEAESLDLILPLVSSIEESHPKVAPKSTEGTSNKSSEESHHSKHAQHR